MLKNSDSMNNGFSFIHQDPNNKDISFEFYVPYRNETIVIDNYINGLTAGFFSCCSVSLFYIISFFNNNKIEPKNIRYKQFNIYKTNNNFFKHPNDQKIKFNGKIDYHYNYQYIPYYQLDFKGIIPFIEKYFQPNNETLSFISTIVQKYNINPNNTAAVFYRGTDKCKETGIGTYKEYFDKCQEIYNQDPTIRFLVQADELEFRAEFCSNFKNSFFIDEIPGINKQPFFGAHHQNNNISYQYLGIVYLMSKVKHLIVHSGNGSIWTILYRGNVKNVHQYFKNINQDSIGKWIE